MSCNYAEGLSHYDNKGKLGLAEKFEDEPTIKEKSAELAKWISEASHVVVHTGAGISTSAGIPDFRGPKGVWTLEAKGLKPNINTSFDDAIPTKTHMALLQLVKAGLVNFVVSQNIDGLHLKSGLPRAKMAELHGNMFVDQCQQCGRHFIRSSATKSVGQKSSDVPCPAKRLNGRPCRGKLHDTILDWEHNLPEKELALADFHSCVADLSICLGTTLQIIPSGTLPLHTKKHGKTGKLAIVNLQPTKHDRQADLRINTYVDKVLEHVCECLGLSIPEYSADMDPTKQPDTRGLWTIPQTEVTKMRRLYEETCCKGKKNIKRRSKSDDKGKGLTEKRAKKEENFKNELSDLKTSHEIGKSDQSSNPISEEKPTFAYKEHLVKDEIKEKDEDECLSKVGIINSMPLNGLKSDIKTMPKLEKEECSSNRVLQK